MAEAPSPMDRKVAYLDHAASAPLLPAARAALVAGLELCGNPSSVHAPGRALRALLETGREQVAALAGAQPRQVVFTGSATEALTQAIVGGVAAFKADAVVVSAVEHAAVLRAAEGSGRPVRVLGVDGEGRIDLDTLAGLIEMAETSGETLLVALHWVNNETGVVQDRARIEALVGPTRHVLVLDAVQGFGKLPLDFSASAPDMVAVSGHKIGGPAGIGALLMKGHADGALLIPGGGQELGRRGGTEAAALAAGFGAACQAFPEAFARSGASGLTARLETGLKAALPEAAIFSAGAERIGTTTGLAVPGLRNATALMALDLAGVAVSSGSACSSGKVGRSHVLDAMGVTPELAGCALRASLGWNSTQADVEAFLAALTLLARGRGRSGKAA